jgi:type II secretory pathway pseudopilin PulG
MYQSTHKSTRRTGGFGIAEAIVAVAIFAIVIASVAPVLMTLVGTNHRNEQRAEASYAAQRVLDELRQRDFPNWPASGATGTVNTGQTVYEYELTYCTNGNDQFCRTNVRQARVEISYQGDLLYDVEVVYTDLGSGSDNITK